VNVSFSEKMPPSKGESAGPSMVAACGCQVSMLTAEAKSCAVQCLCMQQLLINLWLEHAAKSFPTVATSILGWSQTRSSGDVDAVAGALSRALPN
jgi:hypothetical protein